MTGFLIPTCKEQSQACLTLTTDVRGDNPAVYCEVLTQED